MTSPDPIDRARRAVFTVFALAGLSFMAFASRMPDVKRLLGLSPGQLGTTLLALSAGSLIGLPASGRISHRFGAAAAVGFGLCTSFVGLGLAGAGVDLADSRWVVMVGLFLAGIGIGVWDVGMNLEGATIERLTGRSVMPRFHAAFSGGTVVGASVGALLSALHFPVVVHLVTSGVLVASVGFAALGRFLPHATEGSGGRVDEVRGPVASAWTERRTLLIGVVTMIAAATEGTANDWLSVAMVDGHHLPGWAGTLCFATFLSFMTVGRISGTGLLDRYGRVPLLRSMFALAFVGALMVVFGSWPLAFVGAACWGLGASLGFPVGMSASADDPLRAAARMSVVSTVAYTAFLGGPPLLGFLGDHLGVLRALLFIGVLAVVALALAPVTREPAPSATLDPPQPTAAPA